MCVIEHQALKVFAKRQENIIKSKLSRTNASGFHPFHGTFEECNSRLSRYFDDKQVGNPVTAHQAVEPSGALSIHWNIKTPSERKCNKESVHETGSGRVNDGHRFVPIKLEDNGSR